MNDTYLKSPDDGLFLLQKMGSSKGLMEHHRIVVKMAEKLLYELPVTIRSLLDTNLILIGCSIHDFGKVGFPLEEFEPGNDHEQAGRYLLLSLGLPDVIARFCMVHSNDIHEATLEELIIGISDNLSRGSRDTYKELELAYRLHSNFGLNYLETLTALDDLIDRLANRAHSKFLYEVARIK